MLTTSVQMHGENVSAQLANCCGEACDQVVKGSGLRQVNQRRFCSVPLHLWTSDSSTQRLSGDGTRKPPVGLNPGPSVYRTDALP